MIIAANFKANMTRATSKEYIEKVNNFSQSLSQDIYIFPPATALDTFDTNINVGSQNAYSAQNGAFTGETALEQLEEFGIDTILIGHSERRHVLKETQEDIARKFAFYKEKNFKIIYCVGETLEIRESGNSIMMKYILDQFTDIDVTYTNLVIAYEPVWAIGTGLTPTDLDIELIHTAIKQEVEKPLLYGGSVKVDNAKTILALNNVDGILVGSAALKVDDFCSMIRDAQDIEDNN
jgi:triosephosphate isomerase